ncbi:MAG: hypothetical protein AB1473_16305 [Thermodesulfobacteriota bacterium]
MFGSMISAMKVADERGRGGFQTRPYNATTSSAILASAGMTNEYDVFVIHAFL